MLPKDSVIDATRDALAKEGEWALQYGPTTGDPRLKEALLEKLKRDQGIDAGPENLLISAGASQAVALATEIFVEPGDVVISEAPTWAGAVRRFNHAGAKVVEIDVERQGLDTKQLERVLRELRAKDQRVKLLYLIPNFQNPLGVTTTLERRKRILEISNRYNIPILEDDAYYDLRYDGEFLPTLYSLDQTGSVLYMGTYSKIMAAGIRLGWAVADPEIINRMAGLKFEGGTNMFASQVAAEWTANGTLESHIDVLRGHYRKSRDTMLSALKAHMPKDAHWTRPDGGFFIWLTLPKGIQAREVAAAAADEGVIVSPGPGFYYSNRGREEIRLSYAFPTEHEIEYGIETLATIVKDKMKQKSSKRLGRKQGT